MITLSRPIYSIYKLVILLLRGFIFEEISEEKVNKSANRLYIYAPKWSSSTTFSSYLVLLVWRSNIHIISHQPTSPSISSSRHPWGTGQDAGSTGQAVRMGKNLGDAVQWEEMQSDVCWAQQHKAGVLHERAPAGEDWDRERHWSECGTEPETGRTVQKGSKDSSNSTVTADMRLSLQRQARLCTVVRPMCQAAFRVCCACMVPLAGRRQGSPWESAEKSSEHDFGPGGQNLWRKIERSGPPHTWGKASPGGHGANIQDSDRKGHGKEWDMVPVSDTDRQGHPQCRWPTQPQASRLDTRRHFFSQRVVESWNNIPSSLKQAETVRAFKNGYRDYRAMAEGTARWKERDRIVVLCWPQPRADIIWAALPAPWRITLQVSK